ncbi:MAG: hypothetical protein ACK5O7_02365 [Holosporales bacterium]
MLIFRASILALSLFAANTAAATGIAEEASGQAHPSPNIQGSSSIIDIFGAPDWIDPKGEHGKYKDIVVQPYFHQTTPQGVKPVDLFEDMNKYHYRQRDFFDHLAATPLVYTKTNWDVLNALSNKLWKDSQKLHEAFLAYYYLPTHRENVAEAAQKFYRSRNEFNLQCCLIVEKVKELGLAALEDDLDGGDQTQWPGMIAKFNLKNDSPLLRKAKFNLYQRLQQDPYLIVEASLDDLFEEIVDRLLQSEGKYNASAAYVPAVRFN